MAPTIYMTVGISGSGKSKFANFFLNGVDATEINYDNLRKEISGSVSSQEDNDKVFRVADNKMIAELAGGNNVFLSNTNLNIYNIKQYLKRFPYNKIVVFVMEDSFEKDLCLNRVRGDIENGVDRSNVPDEVINRQYDKFNKLIDELEKFHNKNVEIKMVDQSFYIK